MIRHSIPIAPRNEVSALVYARDLVAELLLRRWGNKIDLNDYIDGRLRHVLPSPFTISGMSEASNEIIRASQSERGVTVCSDYDADGVCSAAIITKTLEGLGYRPKTVIIPDRFKDGHGLSQNVVDQIIADKPTLLIVLDIGTTATTAIKALIGAGIKVVAADHHHAPEGPPEWPNGAFLLNPGIYGEKGTQPGQEPSSGLGDMCAGGLSLMLSIALRRAADRPDLDLSAQLGLAALATVADMVPLTRINRAIVRAGLPHLADIPGIRAIAAKSRLRADEVTARHCGFVYGPCLNAAGRISHANTALDLLVANDPAEIEAIAAKVVDLNLERRALQQEVTDACVAHLKELTDDDTGVLIQNNDFHPGVIGLAASRILDETGRPSIVIGHDGVGSARSPENFHIGDFIGKARAAGLLVTGGGHAAAGGFRLASLNGHLEQFKDLFANATNGVKRPTLIPDFIVDGETLDTNMDLPQLIATLLNTMEPIGIGNETPTIECRNFSVTPGKVFGAHKQHASIFARLGRRPLEMTVFNFGKIGLRIDDLRKSRRIAVARGSFEAGYPDPYRDPGRISLKYVEFSDD